MHDEADSSRPRPPESPFAQDILDDAVVQEDSSEVLTLAPILEAAVSLAPCVEDKVRYVEADLREVELPPLTSVLGVHACGGRTDWCIDVARRLGGPIAIMPCCYTSAAKQGPRVLREQLGRATPFAWRSWATPDAPYAALRKRLFAGKNWETTPPRVGSGLLGP